jgi:sialate O-acetylesterase
VLYNSMIYPLKDFSFKGIIWYQGESTTTRAFQYKKLFQELILDWRKTFNQAELPFLFVQLASFHQEDKKPQESVWAELRQAQADALFLPKTGMATAIDLGDADDIHPPFKKELAYRLAMSAYRVAYKERIFDAGAELISVSQEDNRIKIKVAGNTKPIYNRDKYAYVNGFAIAGADMKYEWARAYLTGNEIWLQSDKVANPQYIRYAWSDNPGKLSIYTSDGLPLLPFKTDKLPWSTEPK